MREKITRQITTITPASSVYGEAMLRTLSDEVETGDRSYRQRTADFENYGVAGLVARDEAEAAEVAATLARYKFATANGYLADIASSIYTMITRNVGSYDYRELLTRDPLTGTIEVFGGRVIVSLETLYKAAFGPLVDGNGRAIIGAGGIVKKAKDIIIPMIAGLKSIPMAVASFNYFDVGSGEVDKYVVQGRPINIHRITTSNKTTAIAIDLDYLFFPVKENGDRLRANAQFIHQVAGLTSFLQLGARIENDRRKTGVTASTARRIILAAQSAYELRSFAPGIAKENRAGRINIALRRNAVRDLYPTAINNENRIRFKDFSDAVSTSGRYYLRAIEATGIRNELLSNPKIIIPAAEKGAEFPEDNQNIVLIKADKAQNI